MVCSSECRDAKLLDTKRRSAKRQSDRKARVDKSPIREAVGRRDGRACLLCGAPSPHLHRVRYGSEGGRYEVDNCVFLCDYHHLYTVHGNKRVWQPLLLDHLAHVDGARAAIRRQLRRERQP